MPIDFNVYFRFVRLISENKYKLDVINIHYEQDYRNLLNDFMSEEDKGDIFVENEYIYNSLYRCIINSYRSKSIKILSTKLSFDWLSEQYLFASTGSYEEDYIEELYLIIDKIKNRVLELGGQITLELNEVNNVNISIIAEKIQSTSNEKLKLELSEYHYDKMYEEYLERHNTDESIFHAKLCYKYNNKQSSGTANNIGYVLMINEEYGDALELFNVSIENSKTPNDKIFPLYNKSIIYALQGEMTKSLENIDIVIDILTANKLNKYKAECLMLPELNDGRLEFKEICNKPIFLDTANLARKNIETMLH